MLESNTPKQLVETLVCLFGLHFALRGTPEHENLWVGENSQLKVLYDDVAKSRYILYTEDVSKTSPGDADHIKIKRRSLGLMRIRLILLVVL